MITADDPAGVRAALRGGRLAVRRLLDQPPRSPTLGAEAFFRYYSAVEAHCRWMETAGQGTRDLYSRGAGALAAHALAHGITSTCLFFSLTGNQDQMRRRVLGLADACRQAAGQAVTVRLTVPRSRRSHRSYTTSEVIDLIAPLIALGTFVGFDLSGLDSDVPVSETLEMVDWLLLLREAADRYGSRCSVSVHYGESISPEGVGSMLQLAVSLAAAGVDSLGHGIMLWSPEMYRCRRADVAAALDRCRSAGMLFEVCPAVAHLYGCRRDAHRLPVGVADLGGRVRLGSDAPGLLGYDTFREATLRLSGR